MVLPALFVKGVSTAGSRKGLFLCGCGGVLHAFCGVGIAGEGRPDIGVPWSYETRAA